MKKGRDLFTGLKMGFLFTGTIVGAGFASGKETFVFFGKTGNFFPLICILAAGLFFLTVLLFMTRAKRDRLFTLSDITRQVFKKGYSIFDLFIILCQLVVFSAMIAGVDSLFGEILNINSKIPLFSVFTLILCCFAVSFGIDGLLEINLVLIPVIIIFIFLIVILKPDINAEVLAKDILPQGPLAFSVLSCVSYIGMNMLLAINILIRPCEKLEKKHIYMGAAFGSLFIGALMFAIGTALFSGPSQIINADMPMLALTGGMPGIFRLLCLIVIWCGIFTSMISSMLPVVEYAKKRVKNKFLTIVIVAIIGFLLSRIGFSSIIGFLFPAMGVVGVVLIIAFWISSLKKKEYKLPRIIHKNEA